MDEAIRRSNFKKQARLSLIDAVVTLPFVIVYIILVSMSGSMMLFMTSVDTFVDVIHSVTLFIVAAQVQKESRFRFDYGMGKVEAFGSFLMGLLMYLGFTIVIINSISSIIHPHHPHDILLFAIVIKIGAIVFDSVLYFNQKRLENQSDSKLMSAGSEYFLKNVIFDTIMLATILISFIFRGSTFALYFEPIVCILFAGYLMVRTFKHTKEAVFDLLDKTLDEDEQHKILKCLIPVSDLFERFRGVRTRRSGNIIYVDLLVGFSPDTQYADVEHLLKEFSSLIKSEISESRVSIVLCDDGQV